MRIENPYVAGSILPRPPGTSLRSAHSSKWALSFLVFAVLVSGLFPTLHSTARTSALLAWLGPRLTENSVRKSVEKAAATAVSPAMLRTMISF